MPNPGRFVPILACAWILSGCLDPQNTLLGPPDDLAFAVSDAANGGRAGFYFQPPVASVGTYAGTFDATLLPVLAVRVCPIDGAGACTGPDVAELTASSSPALNLDESTESYGGVWMSSAPGNFRARVYAGGALLGFADIAVVARGSDLKSVPDGFVGIVRRSALSIRFRVEMAVVGRVAVSPDAARLIGGSFEDFTATVFDLHDNPMPGVTVDWSVNPASLAGTVPTSGTSDGAGQHTARVNAEDAGSGTIVASAGGVPGSATLEVLDPTAIVGYAAAAIPNIDACGAIRICESRIGNFVTDAIRATYGADFAIMNSGGIRAPLTCPTSDDPFDSCPAFTPPPYPITYGQLLRVLPFGNRAFTASVSGTVLRAMLENAVSSMPLPHGRFGQVSGLCFTYDIAATVGSRVTGAVRQAADGSCTGAAVDLSAAAQYVVVINDFMAGGGDGYPDVLALGTLADRLEDVVGQWIAGNTPIAPVIQGRITCVSSGAQACPVVIP